MRFFIMAAIAASSLWASFAFACLEAPLPTTPSGPSWSEVYEDRSSSGTLRYSAEVTAWRHVCPDDEVMLLLTLEAVHGTPWVCSVSFDVIQGGGQYSNVRLRQSPGGSSICGDMLVKSTFLVEQASHDTQWNDQAAFNLAWNSNVFLEVGAYNPSDYGQSAGPKPMHGSMSGSWYDPTRSGEGFAIDFSQNVSGPVATIYWFTHKGGKPYWLIGTSTYNSGQKEITFDLLEVSGTGFGIYFDPDELGSEVIGAISLEFDSCNSGVAAWEMNDGETGMFELLRIAGQVHGAPCQ